MSAGRTNPLQSWRYLCNWWEGETARAEQCGAMDYLALAECEATAARRMVDIHSATSEGPAATWKRLGRAVTS